MASEVGKWQEVQQAASGNRRELVLSGDEVSKRIEEDGLDVGIFQLHELNFLEISKTALTVLPDEVGKLVCLTSLVLHTNTLTSIPNCIENLKQLKLLDLSRNQLQTLPEGIGHLGELQTLNVNGNKLSQFPDVSGLVQLHVLDVSDNQLEALPEIPATLNLLAQVNASRNELTELSSELAELPALKNFDVSHNKLTEIPPEIGNCQKLKEFNFADNKLKDRRLGKMMGGCSTKAILDYLRNEWEKQQSQDKSKGKAKKGKRKKTKSKSEDDVEDLSKNLMRVLHFPDDGGLTISVDPEIENIRPYLVCCIVRNLNLHRSSNMFKRFITLQTKLHDGICQKRQAATIATHDLSSIKRPLVYTAKDPSQMRLIPLFKKNEVTAQQLVGKLRQEAEELRKEKKRNTLSGIHKYLDLLKGKPLYPCLVDADDVIISFPPITNCDVTKTSADTTDILIEVTSSVKLDTCKKVMDEFLHELLEMGLGEDETSQVEAGAAGEEQVQQAATSESKPLEWPMKKDQKLVIEQVKVTDENGGLKVVYPSRTDLQSDAYRVIRE